MIPISDEKSALQVRQLPNSSDVDSIRNIWELVRVQILETDSVGRAGPRTMASGTWTTFALARLNGISQPLLMTPFQRIHLNRGLLYKASYLSNDCFPQDVYAF